jgi:hypothetical protein
MTFVPGAPIASPGDSHGSGEPFPGRERQPRRRKSENPDNSGSSLPAERNCRSSQRLSLPESIRPEHPQKLALNRRLRKPLEVASLRQKPSGGASMRWCFAEPNRWTQPSSDRHTRDHALRLGASGRGTLRRDRIDRWCFDRRKALFKHREGVPKIVSARRQRNGEQRICDI